MYAPIIVFGFNRPLQFKRAIDSLLSNPEAKWSDLYVFIDGPRAGNINDETEVENVFKESKKISGFRNITINKLSSNNGLAKSIISGVSQVIIKYGSAIVLEDDLIVQPNFLSFMNLGLSQFKESKQVWSICGYSNKIQTPDKYQFDGYFCTRSSSWGWGTWHDRWESVIWSFNNWNEWRSMNRDFNKWGGSDCFSMLKACKDGKNHSWAIRFCFNQFLQDKVSLFPVKSLVINDGFDGNGTNCRRYSRFTYELMDISKHSFLLPSHTGIIPSIKKQVMRYNSIPMRIWSKLMYVLKR